MSKIDPFETACKASGYHPADVIPDVSKMPTHLQKSTIAGIKLAVIQENINNGKEVDWTDGNQRKWTAWLQYSPSLGAFVCSYTYYTFTITTLGARFWFFTEADARKFFEDNAELHNDLLLNR